MKGDDWILLGVFLAIFASPWLGFALIVIGFFSKD